MNLCCWCEDDKIVGNVIIEVILVGCEGGRDWKLRIVEGIEHKARSQKSGARRKAMKIEFI
jgi:hypothetical protein